MLVTMGQHHSFFVLPPFCIDPARFLGCIRIYLVLILVGTVFTSLFNFGAMMAASARLGGLGVACFFLVKLPRLQTMLESMPIDVSRALL